MAAAIQAAPGRPLGWVARTDRLDDVAERLGLTVSAGSRAGRDGRVLRWRLAGVEEAAAEPSLPLFVGWGPGTPLPGRAPAAHPGGPSSWRGSGSRATPDRVAAWLGDSSLPIEVETGAPALAAVVLAGDVGEIVVRDL